MPISMHLSIGLHRAQTSDINTRPPICCQIVIVLCVSALLQSKEATGTVCSPAIPKTWDSAPVHSTMKSYLAYYKLSDLYFCLILFIFSFSSVKSSNFNDNFAITWGNDHVKLSGGGETAQLMLDQASGCGFASKNNYLFGSISMKIKLVPGNSAGTVTTYYMSSETSSHDEIDFEFLGNLPGNPYILQTNVFSSGVGNREQRIHLWFDPSAEFHNYSILWNHKQIVFAVDSTTIRVFKNNEAAGVSYPKSQPMKIFSTLWNGEDWATQGGKVKIDWSDSPFVATYQGFAVDACVASNSSPPCASGNWWDRSEFQSPTRDQLKKLNWVRKKYMIYDYCNDSSGRFSTTPAECSFNP